MLLNDGILYDRKICEAGQCQRADTTLLRQDRTVETFQDGKQRIPEICQRRSSQAAEDHSFKKTRISSGRNHDHASGKRHIMDRVLEYADQSCGSEDPLFRFAERYDEKNDQYCFGRRNVAGKYGPPARSLVRRRGDRGTVS